VLLHCSVCDVDSALNTEEIQMRVSSGAVRSSNTDSKARRKNNTKGNVLIGKLPFSMGFCLPILHHESNKGCHPNHGYNFVNSWWICKNFSLPQRAVNFKQVSVTVKIVLRVCGRQGLGHFRLSFCNTGFGLQLRL